MEEECKSGDCGCSSNECGCGQESCKCGSESSCCEGRSGKIDMFMYLVHEAKMELIKEKMKKRLEAMKGKQFDQVADMFVNAMMEKCKDKAESERKMEELEQKFYAVFEKE